MYNMYAGPRYISILLTMNYTLAVSHSKIDTRPHRIEPQWSITSSSSSSSSSSSRMAEGRGRSWESLAIPRSNWACTGSELTATSVENIKSNSKPNFKEGSVVNWGSFWWSIYRWETTKPSGQFCEFWHCQPRLHARRLHWRGTLCFHTFILSMVTVRRHEILDQKARGMDSRSNTVVRVM